MPFGARITDFSTGPGAVETHDSKRTSAHEGAGGRMEGNTEAFETYMRSWSLHFAYGEGCAQRVEALGPS